MPALPARLLHTLSAGSGIHSLAVAGNGRAITGSRDGMITLWDVAHCRQLRAFPTGHEIFLSLAVRADGKRAVSGGLRRLKLWDLESGRAAGTIDTSADDIKVLMFGPEGTCLSGHRYGGILAWDLDAGKRLASLEAVEISAFSRLLADPDEVTAMAITADGQRLVAGSSKGFLRVWDLWAGRCLHTIPAHLLDVTGIVIPPNGLRGLSASWDGTIKCWALEKDTASAKVFEGKAMVCCLALLAGGDIAVWGTDAGELFFGDVADKVVLERVEAHDKAVSRLAVWGNDHILSASEDGTLKVWGWGRGARL